MTVHHRCFGMLCHLSGEGPRVDWIIKSPEWVSLRLEQLGKVHRQPLQPEKHPNLFLRRVGSTRRTKNRTTGTIRWRRRPTEFNKSSKHRKPQNAVISATSFLHCCADPIYLDTAGNPIYLPLRYTPGGGVRITCHSSSRSIPINTTAISYINWLTHPRPLPLPTQSPLR